MLQQNKPNDFVLATGETRSVREMTQYVFRKLNMNYEYFVQTDSKYLRPEELNYLKGDSTKARNILNWKPKYNFEELMDEMVEHWEREFSK